MHVTPDHPRIVALNSELLNSGKWAKSRGPTIPQPFRDASTENKNGPHCCGPFRFLVETWGIEPQTSRVRF